MFFRLRKFPGWLSWMQQATWPMCQKLRHFTTASCCMTTPIHWLSPFNPACTQTVSKSWWNTRFLQPVPGRTASRFKNKVWTPDSERWNRLNKEVEVRACRGHQGLFTCRPIYCLQWLLTIRESCFYMTSLMFLFGAMMKMFCRMPTLEQRQIRVDMPWMVITQSIFQRDLCMAGFASEHGACLTSHPLSISMLNMLEK